MKTIYPGLSGRLSVIGNGPGKMPVTLSPGVIGFNNCNELPNHAICVLNGRRSGNLKSFKVMDYEHSKRLEELLISTAQSIQNKIGAWPSTGLTLIEALRAHSKLIEVYRMPLLDSLVRPLSLSIRKPLDASFHNWLGERRVALKQLDQTISWPGLLLTKDSQGIDFRADPFEALFALTEGPRDSLLLSALSEVSADCWLNYSSALKLEQAETLFFLSRKEKQTQNWWLFDVEGSLLADSILKRIAWCQQHIISA